MRHNELISRTPSVAWWPGPNTIWSTTDGILTQPGSQGPTPLKDPERKKRFSLPFCISSLLVTTPYSTQYETFKSRPMCYKDYCLIAGFMRQMVHPSPKLHMFVVPRQSFLETLQHPKTRGEALKVRWVCARWRQEHRRPWN